MRTTLSIDDDVAVLVEGRQTLLKQSLKTVINDALRRGLAAEPAPAATRFVTPTFSLGTSSYPNLDSVANVLAVAEGDRFQ
jgi:hypothetical protein